MKKTRIAALLLVAVLFLIGTTVLTSVSSQPTEAQSPQNLSKYDITGSAHGIQLAQEAVARWNQEALVYCNQYGASLERSSTENVDVKVYEFGKDNYLIAPASAEITLQYTKNKDGSYQIEPLIATPRPSTNKVGVANIQTTSAASSIYWGFWAQQCYTRIENTAGWIDHCVWIEKLCGETDSSKDYYNMHHYATARSKGVWALKSAYVQCVKSGSSAPMQWVDWSPRADIPNGNCQQYTLGCKLSASAQAIHIRSAICGILQNILQPDSSLTHGEDQHDNQNVRSHIW